MNKLKIAVGQLNTTVGDIAGNVTKHIELWKQAKKDGADLLACNELSLSGYPLEDLIENPDVLEQCNKAIEKLVEISVSEDFFDCGILVGAPIKGAINEDGRNVYNAAILISNGEIKHIVHKQKLPTYDVFDEKRNNAPGKPSMPVQYKGVNLGVLICEDTWYQDVSAGLVENGAQILLSINSSPYEVGKHDRRVNDVVRARAKENNVPVIYVAQVGGQDEIVFDGASIAVSAEGRLKYQAKAFEEDYAVLDIEALNKMPALITSPDNIVLYPDKYESIWHALCLGLRDYTHKIWGEDKQVVLGMSGGIDSAVVAAIAADSLGADRVNLVSMPYRYTSAETKGDAQKAAEMLGANFTESPIVDTVQAHLKILSNDFNIQAEATLTEENLQARERGVKIMALANHFHWLPLSTGNKSEVSVGYCTLYGDMNGGFNPLKDVPKSLVFELARWRNEKTLSWVRGPQGAVMPDTIITRPASAELSEGQEDENVLGSYKDDLDPVLKLYIEEEKSVAEVIAITGKDKNYVDSMISKVDIAEFKRRQSCPGTKITGRSFGKGRRVPITRPTTPRMIADMKQVLS